MTARQAAHYLAHYPSLWQQRERLREELLFGGGRDSAFTTQARGGPPPDPTGKRAIRLAVIDERFAPVLSVPRFLETLTIPQRKLVLSVWRYRNYLSCWKRIERETGIPAPWAAWQELAERFAEYLEDRRKACAGPA